jgi:hypothetical protein
LLLPLGAAGIGAFWWSRRTPELPAKNAGDLVDTAKRGANDFLRCLAEDEPGLDLWRKKDDFLRIIITKHYRGMADRMRYQCLPALAKFGSSLKTDRDPPDPLVTALNRYKDVLKRVEERADRFVQKSVVRAEDEQAFHAIARAAIEWAEAPVPAQPAPFERFFVCAVPGLPTMKEDGKELYQFFSHTCFHGDPVGFMTRIRRDCGPALRGAAVSPANGASDPLSARRFHGNPGFMRLLWEACAKEAYKVWISNDDGDDVLKSLSDLRDAGSQLVVAAVHVLST